MSNLENIQCRFQNYVLYGNENIIHNIVDTKKIRTATCLEIYFDAYRLRLHESLQEDYPALEALLGCEDFNKLCSEYINMHSSHYRSIRWYGHNLAAFLQQTKPYNEHPILNEMAQLEWSLMTALNAKDSSVMSIKKVASIKPSLWPKMQLIPHPSLHTINCEWNTVEIWQATDHKETPPEPQKREDMTTWLLWRDDLQILFRSLTVDEAWAINAMLIGKSFAQICEGLTEWIDEQHAAAHAAGMLRTWVEDKLIHDIHTQ